MFPSTEDFSQLITIILRTSQVYNESFKILTAKHVHTFIGGYPGINHRIPNCCRGMRSLMIEGDEIKGNPNDGANFTIKYKIPRY